MSATRAVARAERLKKMEQLYLLRPYSDTEMAERLSVNRSTVFKDRGLLSTELQFNEERPGHWRIDKRHYLSNVRLTLDEALALYLAGIRMARHTYLSQPHVVRALEKLVIILPPIMTEQLQKASNSVLNQRQDRDRLEVIEKLATAWSESYKVELKYFSLRAQAPLMHVFSIYLLEPAIWSEGIYVIGYSDTHRKVITLRAERIQEAHVLLTRFEIPKDFSLTPRLKDAWGIWTGPDAPVQVRLRFSAGVAARRVQETTWHRSQEIVAEPDGGCVLLVRVGNTTEMKHFIRQWGPDCEVLEPQALREEIAADMAASAARYSAAA
jgi:predicted DNA-binding transcriptional regulator YafY